MNYTLSHVTVYRYASLASLSHNEIMLVPRSTPVQHCISNDVTLTPRPSAISRRTDYFGNTVISANIIEPHESLEIRAGSLVELLTPPRQLPLPDDTPPWETVRDHFRQPLSFDDLAAFQFAFASPLIPVSPVFAEWGRTFFTPGAPVLKAALEMTASIFNGFKYDPGATTSTTPVEVVFDNRRGVCQDFAQLQIAGLRSIGLCARYVSGYLHTLPPPGKEKLIGADASHAWLSVYIPGTGWVDLDPTNNVIPHDRHVTLAWGRDYSDVTPVKGTVLGGGSHQLSVSVDVNRTEEIPLKKIP